MVGVKWSEVMWCVVIGFLAIDLYRLSYWYFMSCSFLVPLLLNEMIVVTGHIAYDYGKLYLLYGYCIHSHTYAGVSDLLSFFMFRENWCISGPAIVASNSSNRPFFWCYGSRHWFCRVDPWRSVKPSRLFPCSFLNCVCRVIIQEENREPRSWHPLNWKREQIWKTSLRQETNC